MLRSRVMGRAHRIFNKPQSAGLAGALTLLLVIGLLDALTGNEAGLTLFYALPIMLAVWQCGARLPLLVAFTASMVWWIADVFSAHTYPSPFVQAWNVAVRTGFFFAVSIAGTASRQRQRAADARIQLLERAQELEHQVIEVSEYEQQRIGRDLHDGLCQYLAAIACSASSLQHKLETRGLPDFARSAGELAELLSNGVIETRNLSHGLMPVEIGHGGLAVALRELTDSTTQLAGIRCTFDHAGAELARHDLHATHLIRIAQEAIHNAVRHGKASNIHLSLTTNEHAATLSIADDGVGVSKAKPSPRGMGISIMRYRANALGGELLMEDRQPRGTIVSCTAPSPHRNGG
jgi:signal transduction histidine kinase